MDKSIEAAARALWVSEKIGSRDPIGWWNDLPESSREIVRDQAHAAIAAYLAETGVERDAERYRFLKGNFGICRPFDELLIWHADEIDAAIDAARGGER